MKVASLVELRRWSLEDGCIAHEWLDELELAEAKAREQARASAQMREERRR